jgi:hypothetical protein
MDVKAVVAEMEQATHLEDSFYLVDAIKAVADDFEYSADEQLEVIRALLARSDELLDNELLDGSETATEAVYTDE